MHVHVLCICCSPGWLTSARCTYLLYIAFHADANCDAEQYPESYTLKTMGKNMYNIKIKDVYAEFTVGFPNPGISVLKLLERQNLISDQIRRGMKPTPKPYHPFGPTTKAYYGQVNKHKREYSAVEVKADEFQETFKNMPREKALECSMKFWQAIVDECFRGLIGTLCKALATTHYVKSSRRSSRIAGTDGASAHHTDSSGSDKSDGEEDSAEDEGNSSADEEGGEGSSEMRHRSKKRKKSRNPSVPQARKPPSKGQKHTQNSKMHYRRHYRINGLAWRQ